MGTTASGAGKRSPVSQALILPFASSLALPLAPQLCLQLAWPLPQTRLPGTTALLRSPMQRVFFSLGTSQSII